MRIGILTEGFVNWGGGIDFLRMLLSSIRIAAPEASLHVVFQDRGPHYAYCRGVRRARAFAKRILYTAKLTEPVSQSAPMSFAAEAAEYGVVHHIDATNGALLRLCREQGLDALVPAATPLGADFPVPWIGYLYDFQHRCLPGYFTQLDCDRRDAAFSRMLDVAPAVVVNAQSVAADVGKFFPAHRARVVPLPFAAAPQGDWLQDRPEVAETYGLGGVRYFMISNQFWLHKRHDVAFEAFAKVAPHAKDVRLVCTGATGDYRDLTYFDRLRRQIQRAGVADLIHILGVIPKRHQIELLKHAVAVVQPTLFEGGPGGGSVYDAVSLGVRTIVSDIPVNREIARWVTRYVPPAEPEALACAMLELLESPPRARDPEQLLAAGRARRAECGRALMDTLSAIRTDSRQRSEWLS